MTGKAPEFLALLTHCKVPLPEAEFRFAPPRRWRFDYRWPNQKLALEVQGGLFIGGRHSRGPALLKEHEKLNTAARMGYRILYTTPKQLVSFETATTIKQALEAA